MNLRRFLPHIALVIGAVLFSAGLQTLAFTPPSSAPPTGDAYAPLTTSDVPQGKVAGLDLGAITTKGGAIINTVGGSWHGLIVENGNVGIGTRNPGERLEVNGNVKASAFWYSSDINLKQNIQNIPNALQKIQQLNGVYFQWKESSKDGVGVIAQDIEKVFPELVATDPNTGLKSVSYGNLVAPLIEAIKEQQKQIDELKAEIEVLKNK